MENKEDKVYRHVKLEHPKNEEGLYLDMLKKYHKYGKLVIGVDFDNTLMGYESKEVCEDVVDLLRRCKGLGMILCLWTLPMSDENLEWKVRWCRDMGIEMDYVNCSPLLSEYSNKYGKPHFNILLDDIAGLEGSYSVLYNVCEVLEKGM